MDGQIVMAKQGWIFPNVDGDMRGRKFYSVIGGQSLMRTQDSHDMQWTILVTWRNGVPYYKEKAGIKYVPVQTPPCPKEASVWETQIGGTHYTKMKIQPFEFSMANGLDPMQHTILKYICRFRDKNGIQDLEKAKQTIDLLIDLEKNKCNKPS